MTSSQTWVLLGLIGVLATGLLALTNLVFVSLRSEIRARFDGLGTAMETRFSAVDRRLDSLDRDVQSLTERFFRDRP